LKARNVFRWLFAKFWANFSRKLKCRFSLLSDTYIIVTSMPMFATYRVKVEWIISEVLTVVLGESRAWKLCTFQVRELFPNFLLVIEICHCIPFQTACCERGNLCLHRIMCDFRSTLGVSLLWKHSCSFLLMVLFLRSMITDWQNKNKRTKKLGSQIWENLCPLYSKKCQCLPSENFVFSNVSNFSKNSLQVGHKSSKRFFLF